MVVAKAGRLQRWANIIANGILVLFAAFVCFAFVFGFAFTIPNGNALSIASGIALSAACIGALFLRAEWKINIGLVSLSILLGVYGIEFVLSVWKISVRTPLDAAEALQAKGVDALPRLLPANFLKANGITLGNGHIYPLSLQSNKTIVLCNESGYWATYAADEHGFNNPAGTFQQQGPDVALVGDSFTQGSCVREGEDVTSRLRALGYTAVNLGTGGIGPLFELAMVTEYAHPLRPRIVLWMYNEGNDLVNLDQERGAPLLMNYLNEGFSQDLISRQSEIDLALNRKFRRYMIQSHLRLVRVRSVLDSLVGGRGGRVYSEEYNRLRERELLSSILEKAQARTKEWGGAMYFVYLPSFMRYDTSHLPDDYASEDLFDKKEVLNIVQKLNIPVIDLTDTFDNINDPLSMFPFRRYGHYTADAYALIARQIADRLKAIH